MSRPGGDPSHDSAIRVGLMHDAPARPPGEPQGAARRLRRRRSEPRDLTLNIVPLVDVTFLLMIFFVIAGTFETWEGVLSSRMLKGGKGPDQVGLPISPVIIRVGPNPMTAEVAELKVDGVSRVPQGFSELAAVLSEVKDQPGFGADTPVVVVADGKVRWDHVVNAWNAALRAGFQRVAFGDR